ncbi:MAG: chain length determinant protein EpsF [Oxalobacteraceae bacterium]|nr:MAG: chain length determinant protein EpsF [Oxalobacteraceae bacterium]
MTPSKLFAILRARWTLALLIVLVTTVTALGVSLKLPKKYVATASVVVDAKPDPISALMYPGMASPSFMNTQVDIIGSDRVAIRVIRDLKLADVPVLREQWQAQTKGEGTIQQWLTDLLQQSMDVKPSKESNVLTVTYKAPDPGFAAALANAFVRAYVATALELRVDPARQYAGYFDQQSKAALEKLEVAKNKLSTYERENGIVATDERLDVETARLVELSSQLVALQAVSSESNRREGQVAGAADRLPDVLNNSVVMQLKTDLGRAEARLQELSTRYGDNYPQVVEAKASVADIRSKLATETRRVGGGVAVTNTINRQREGDIRAQLDAQRVKVAKLKTARDEAGGLMREVESAQRAYESITARLTQTSLESQTTQSNVNVLTEAVAPLKPASPKIFVNTVLAFVVGLVLAAGVVFTLELLDRKVRDVDDVVAVLQAPMLGVLPAPLKGRAKALSAVEGRMLGMGPTASRGAA